METANDNGKENIILQDVSGGSDPATPEAPKTIDSEKKTAAQSSALPDKLPRWLKTMLVIVPAAALVVSAISLCVAIASYRYAAGYTRAHEDHDVVAKILKSVPVIKGWSSSATNGEFYVDLAFINKGNQKEIIRDVFLVFSDTEDFKIMTTTMRKPPLNLQIDKGEKTVLHLSTPFDASITGKPVWVAAVVRAIAPNADDIEVRIPACRVVLATDGNGASYSASPGSSSITQIISEKRLPHQKSVEVGGFL